MNQVSASRAPARRHPEALSLVLILFCITMLGSLAVACKGQKAENAADSTEKAAGEGGDERARLEKRFEAVFGSARSPMLPRDFGEYSPGAAVEAGELEEEARLWSEKYGVSLSPTIADEHLIDWRMEIPATARSLLTKRWGEPKERFGEGRAEWVWLNPATGIEVAMQMPVASGASKGGDSKGGDSKSGDSELIIRGLAPMERIVPSDAPLVPDFFDGLEPMMSRAAAAEARPELDDPAAGWTLPGWPGVEFRVVFGARNLEVWEVVFWTWHPGAQLVERWGEPELLGDPANPQATWRNDEAQVRATILPRSGREVVIRFSRFVPAADWLAERGLLSFEDGSWLGRRLEEVQRDNQDLIWAEDSRTGRVVVRLPSTEYGTDVVLEIERNQQEEVQELVLRYAGTGYPALESAIEERLTAVFGEPMVGSSADGRYETRVFTGKAGRQVVMTDKLAALELSINASFEQAEP